MAGDDDYLEPGLQRARLEAILAAHRDPSGAIPAAALPALASDLGRLLDAVRGSGNTDGYEEALNEQ
jgi:hypothetical protein